MSELNLIGASRSEEQVSRPKWTKASWIGFATPIVFVLLYLGLERLDDTTELYPAHNGSLEACFWIAGLAGIIGCAVTIRKLKAAVWRRVWTAFCLALVCSLTVLLPTMRLVDIINGRIDFPRGETRTFAGLLQVSRAYQTHGKSASADIQTMPLWSNMEITDSDYQFMLSHRRPDDASHDPDEISSRGYFCAKVTMQQSDRALRVLHAGSRKLPPGTVVFCPSAGPPQT